METLKRLLGQVRRAAEGFLPPLLKPNIAVWRNWETLSRTGGLGAIGVSVIAQGGQVEPGSIMLGVVAIAGSVYCAHRIGELEVEHERSD